MIPFSLRILTYHYLKNQSFSSGHSALAWATATTFSLDFKENNMIIFGSYARATFVVIS
tara:strand:+ start:326 stop:502 length:177 start_codon:yes stop_codon:yes gene_type:complete